MTEAERQAYETKLQAEKERGLIFQMMTHAIWRKGERRWRVYCIMPPPFAANWEVANANHWACAKTAQRILEHIWTREEAA